MSVVVDGVHRFGANGINWYAIDADDGLTVVDAGLPAHWLLLSTWLHRSGFSLQDVRAVLLTHNHPDHVGFAGRAAREGAQVRIHSDDLAGLRERSAVVVPARVARNAWRPRMTVRIAQWLRLGAARSVVVAGATPFVDGERLQAPGRPRVLHLPGHTPGSVAFVFDDHGVVCTGDALVTADAATGRPGIGIAPTGLNAHDRQALGSLDRLADVDAPVVLPGHGEPYRHGLPSALQAARAIGADW